MLVQPGRVNGFHPEIMQSTSHDPNTVTNLGIMNSDDVLEHPEPLDAAVGVLDDDPGRTQDGVVYFLALGQLPAPRLLEGLLDADTCRGMAHEAQVLLEGRTTGQIDGVELSQSFIVHTARLGRREVVNRLPGVAERQVLEPVAALLAAKILFLSIWVGVALYARLYAVQPENLAAVARQQPGQFGRVTAGQQAHAAQGLVEDRKQTAANMRNLGLRDAEADGLESLQRVVLEVDQQEEKLLGRASQQGVAVFLEGGVLAQAALEGVVPVVTLPQWLEVAQQVLEFNDRHARQRQKIVLVFFLLFVVHSAKLASGRDSLYNLSE